MKFKLKPKSFSRYAAIQAIYNSDYSEDFDKIKEKNSLIRFSETSFEKPICIYIEFVKSFLVKLILVFCYPI